MSHARLTTLSVSANGEAVRLLGSTAVIILCFFISALNREQSGWVQEKIGLLDRMRETRA